VAFLKRRQDLGQKARILVDHLLVQADRIPLAALRLRELRADQRAAQRARLAIRAVLEVVPRANGVPRQTGLLRQLAVVVRDPRRRLAGIPLELAIRIDRLLPFALALIDFDQLLEGLLRQCLTRTELREQRLRAIEEPGAEVILREREECLMTLRLAQSRPRDQVLMHPDRAVDL